MHPPASVPAPRPSPAPGGPLLLVSALTWAFAVLLLHTRETAAFFGQSVLQEGFHFPAFGMAAAGLWGKHLLRGGGVLLFFLTAYHAGRSLLAFLSGKGFPTPGGAPGAEEWGSPAQERLLAAALGLVLWSAAGLAAAALHLSTPLLMRVFSAAAAAVFLVRLKGGFFRPAARAFRALAGAAAAPQARLPAGLLALAFGLYLAASAAPELFADALVYVLPLPEAYLRHGGMVDLPANLLFRYPGFTQMLYIWGLAWDGDLSCKLMNLGFGALWAAAVGLWTAARWGRAAGFWAAAFLAASPFVGSCIFSCSYETLMGVLLMLSFSLWRRGWAAAGTPEGSAWISLSGLMLGACGASKYTAAFAVPFFALDFLRRRRRDGAPWKPFFLFVAAGAVLPLPWLIRNLWMDGAPFYPHAADLFGHASPAQLKLLASLSFEQHTADGPAARLLKIATESVRGAWDGRFGFIGPVLLMLGPFALLFPKKDRGDGSAALYAGTSYLSYAAATGFLRYYMSHLGLWFSAAAGALSVLEERLGRRAAALRAVAAVAVLTELAAFALVFHVYYHGWDVVLGGVSPEEYLRRPHSLAYRNPPQGAWEHLKKTARPEDKVLLLGESRSFRCPAPHHGNWLYDLPLYVRWFEEGLSPEAFVDRLRSEGFTHVLLNPKEFQWNVVEGYRTKEWTDRLSAVLDLMAPPAYRDPWVILFRVPEERS